MQPPFAARVAAGLAVTLIEETRRLPTTAITLPMTALSQTLQTAMRIQQSMTQLAIKGDEVFALLWGDEEEQPEWATFDEDGDLADLEKIDGFDDETLPTPAADDGRPAPRTDGVRKTGRFALYSAPPPDAPEPAEDDADDVDVPAVAERLDYSGLTLAQLRARLKDVRDVADLRKLAAYERATRARAPFLTLLDNRVTQAEAKS